MKIPVNRIKEVSFIVNHGRIREIGEIEIWGMMRGITEELNKYPHPKTIIAIARGGIWLGCWVRHFFKIDNYYEIQASHYSIEGKKHELKVGGLPKANLVPPILIVDDVVETGETIINVISRLIQAGVSIGDIKSASLIWKPVESTFRPDYFSISSDKWCIFPWEAHG